MGRSVQSAGKMQQTCSCVRESVLASGQGRRRRRQLAAFQGFSGGPDRDACLARHAHLAQSATIASELVSLFHMLSGAGQVLPALFLVVAGFGNGAGRATVNALAAGSLGEKEAISPVVGIGV